MKIYLKPGQVHTFTAPTGGVVSGTAYLVGALVVVATETKAQTLPFEGLILGVVDVPKVADEVWTENLKIYFDESEGKFTLDDDSASNPLVGVAVEPTPVEVSLATDADPSDLLIDGLTLQVLDYAQLASDDAEVTVTVNGVATVLVEGTDFTAETDDDTTATNLAAAIDAIVGVAAAEVDDTVTVTPSTGAPVVSGYVDSAVGRVRLDGVAR